jgi:hypothetical protein
MKKAILAAMCGILLLTGSAWGQTTGTNTVSRNGYYFNQSTQQMTDANGNALTKEAFPIPDQQLTFPNVINNAGLAIGAADSNLIALDTHRMRLATLFLKANILNAGAGTLDTTTTARLAIQIRTQWNGQTDSSSTFAFYQYGYAPSMNGTGAGFVADTTIAGHLYAGLPQTGIAATPTANTCWSGEVEIVVSNKRGAHGNSIAINGHTFYYPSGMAIPISSLFGRDIYSPYTSVRVRVLGISTGSATTAAATCAVTIHLAGTPL